MTRCEFAPASEGQTPSSQALDDFVDLRQSLRETRIGAGGREVCDALTGALDKAVVDLVSFDEDRYSIIALGGYGRRELCLESDVDLMVLHSDDDASDLASDLFRPLWDARLRVGHSVRTLGESRVAARDSFETQTTLLTARLIAGSESLFADLMAVVSATTKARPLRRHIATEEEHRREVEPYLLMAPDLKTGRGGLRTIQAFGWEAKREQLIGRFAPQASFERELETLLRVRNALHATTRRPHDTLSVELRGSVARWLGVEVFDLLSEVVESRNVVDTAARERWPARERRSKTRPGSPLADAIAARDESQIEELIPQWSTLKNLPHADPFHLHPVAEHLWRTVEEMSLLTEDDWYGPVVADVGDDDLLASVALLHDIGKGQPGDHSQVGAVIAEPLLGDLGFAPGPIRLITAAVRLHLLLPVAAATRDLDDQVEIAEVAAQIQDPQLARVLYLLAVADSRATGPAMWNRWKESLLRTLFLRTMEALETGLADETMAGTTREAVMEIADGAGGVGYHIDRMPFEYLSSFTAEEVVRHQTLLEGADADAGMAFTVDEEFQNVVAYGPDLPRRRLDVARALAANGIDVLQARMFSREDGLALDVFTVRDDRAGGAVARNRFAGAQSDFEAAGNGTLDLQAKVEERARSYRRASDEGEVTVEFASTSDRSTLLSIACRDRVGRLAEILEVFIDVGLEFRLATAEVRGPDVVDTFHVATPLPATAAEIESRIRTALRP